MSILQDILATGHVDPELLDALDEEQKAMLFIQMRQEQLRKWRLREEAEARSPSKLTPSNKRRIQWLTGTDGEVWVWVMGEHPDDPSIEEILDEEARDTAQRLARKELETTPSVSVPQPPATSHLRPNPRNAVVDPAPSNSFGISLYGGDEAPDEDEERLKESLRHMRVEPHTPRIAESMYDDADMFTENAPLLFRPGPSTETPTPSYGNSATAGPFFPEFLSSPAEKNHVITTVTTSYHTPVPQVPILNTAGKAQQPVITQTASQPSTATVFSAGGEGTSAGSAPKEKVNGKDRGPPPPLPQRPPRLSRPIPEGSLPPEVVSKPEEKKPESKEEEANGTNGKTSVRLRVNTTMPGEELQRRESEIFQSLQEKREQIRREAEAEAERQRVEWEEQERRARQAEAAIREIAARAREQHRAQQLRTSTSILPALKDTKAASLREAIKNLPRPPKPKSRAAIVDWFRADELPRGTGLDPVTKQPAPWFHGIISRDAAEELLRDKPTGSFLVRVSERIWGYTVSYVVGDGTSKHFLVERIPEGYQFLGTNQLVHDQLFDLVAYHETAPITAKGNEILKWSVGQNGRMPDYEELLSASLPVSSSVTSTIFTRRF